MDNNSLTQLHAKKTKTEICETFPQVQIAATGPAEGDARKQDMPKVSAIF